MYCTYKWCFSRYANLCWVRSTYDSHLLLRVCMYMKVWRKWNLNILSYIHINYLDIKTNMHLRRANAPLVIYVHTYHIRMYVHVIVNTYIQNIQNKSCPHMGQSNPLVIACMQTKCGSGALYLWDVESQPFPPLFLHNLCILRGCTLYVHTIWYLYCTLHPRIFLDLSMQYYGMYVHYILYLTSNCQRRLWAPLLTEA